MWEISFDLKKKPPKLLEVEITHKQKKHQEWNYLPENHDKEDTYTVAEYSWFIANNFVIGVYCRWLQILYQITFFYKI